MDKEQYAIIEDVSKEESKLLEVLRSIKYGQVTIFMQSGKPIRIEHIKESIVL